MVVLHTKIHERMGNQRVFVQFFSDSIPHLVLVDLLPMPCGLSTIRIEIVLI
jgi:hypothetical protein